MTGTIELERESDTAKPPERRWKMRYLFTKSLTSFCSVCGNRDDVQAGDERITHCLTWPTREAADAEAKADAVTAAIVGARYLGAVPVEGA